MSTEEETIFRSPFPDIDIPNVSVPQYILETISKHDQFKPAFIDGTGDKRVITFAQYGTLVKKFAQGISEYGLKKGDVFALYLPNLPEYGIIFHGILLAGGIATTINPLYTTEELENQLKSSNSKYIITIGLFYEKTKEAFENLGLSQDNLFYLGESEGGVSFLKLLANDGSNVPKVDIDPKKDVAVIPYSSGTSGLPKGVVLTHHNVLSNLLQTSTVIGDSRDDDILVGILPFFHIYGMTCIMQFGLLYGATVVVMSRFDLEKFLELVQEYKITLCHLVPPICIGLVKHPIVAKYDLTSIRMVISGAAPLGNELQATLAKKFPFMDVRQGYGMTELSPVTHAIEPRSSVYGSIGKLAPNCEAKIIDVDTLKSVGVGEKGELLIRGPNVMKEYLNNDVETAKTIEHDGFLHTGDIAKVDENGNFWIVDRLKELIKYNGYQCPPAELENLLLSHESIADACVIGSPDPDAFENNELPKAFVVLKPNVTLSAEEVEKFVSDHVAPYKKLRGGVEFIDQIPKSSSGKILRRILKAQEIERVRALLASN